MNVQKYLELLQGLTDKLFLANGSYSDYSDVADFELTDKVYMDIDAIKRTFPDDKYTYTLKSTDKCSENEYLNYNLVLIRKPDNDEYRSLETKYNNLYELMYKPDFKNATTDSYKQLSFEEQMYISSGLNRLSYKMRKLTLGCRNFTITVADRVY